MSLNVKTRSVSLTPENEAFISERVASALVQKLRSAGFGCAEGGRKGLLRRSLDD